MILKRTGQSLLLLFLILSLSQCKDTPFKSDKISEGYIEYDVQYLGDSIDRFIQSFLPDKMKIKFKNHNTKNTLKCMSGLFTITNIKKYKKSTNITLVNFIDKKYKYIESNKDPSLFFQQRPDIIIKHTDSTKQIAGYTCKESKIIYPTKKLNNNQQFSIYHTDKIDIKGFNKQTPFESIDGVLLEFQLLFYGIPMKFTATKVTGKEIPAKEFKVPGNYKRINRKTMKEIIELLK